MSSDETLQKIDYFIKDKYLNDNYKKSLDSSNDTKLPLKIVLHSLEGEQVEFKLNNLIRDDKESKGPADIKFPLDNISLFSINEENGAERVNIYNSFFSLLEKYYNTTVNTLDQQSNSINGLLNPSNTKCQLTTDNSKSPREKQLNKQLLEKQLLCVDNKELDTYTLVDDIYEFAKGFYGLDVKAEKEDIFTKIYGYSYISSALRGDPKYKPDELRKYTEKKNI